MMRLVVSLLAALTLVAPAGAALDIGDRAPDFTASAALAGKVYRYSLADALRKGPVVLYFFPAAYSEGCSVEAHYFAEAVPEFANRISYVIAQDGSVAYHYMSLNPTKHVEKMLGALKAMKR